MCSVHIQFFESPSPLLDLYKVKGGAKRSTPVLYKILQDELVDACYVYIVKLYCLTLLPVPLRDSVKRASGYGACVG